MRSEMRSCRVNWNTSQIPREQTALRYVSERVSERGHENVTRRSELRPHLPKLRLVEPEVPEHPNKYGNTQLRTKY